MKTLLLLISVLLLVAAAIVVDAHRLDAAGWFSAFTVAALFAVASGDRTPRRLDRIRWSGVRATRAAAWAESNTCVLCAAASS